MVFTTRSIFKTMNLNVISLKRRMFLSGIQTSRFETPTKLMALKFVYENKNRLGCSRITINGESAGGASVALLLLNDEAVSYIDGAVAQSGGTLTG